MMLHEISLQNEKNNKQITQEAHKRKKASREFCELLPHKEDLYKREDKVITVKFSFLSFRIFNFHRQRKTLTREKFS